MEALDGDTNLVFGAERGTARKARKTEESREKNVQAGNRLEVENANIHQIVKLKLRMKKQSFHQKKSAGRKLENSTRKNQRAKGWRLQRGERKNGNVAEEPAPVS